MKKSFKLGLIALVALMTITLAGEKAMAQKEDVNVKHQKYTALLTSTIRYYIPRDNQDIQQLKHGYFRMKVAEYYDPRHTAWIIFKDKKILEDSVLDGMPFSEADIQLEKPCVRNYMRKNNFVWNEKHPEKNIYYSVIRLSKAEQLKMKQEADEKAAAIKKKKEAAAEKDALAKQKKALDKQKANLEKQKKDLEKQKQDLKKKKTSNKKKHKKR